jgi:hypothetical protein
MTLGEQIAQDLANKLELVNGEPVRVFAQGISQRSQDNSKSGKAFGNDRYDNEYTPAYAKAKKNGRISPVTLRNGRNRIEKQRVEVTAKDGATIQFNELSNVFKFHNQGINYKKVGFRQRSIFPKLHESVDEDLYLQLHQDVGEVLRYGR